MANKKKEVYRPGPMTEGKRNIIQGLLQEYNIEMIIWGMRSLSGPTVTMPGMATNPSGSTPAMAAWRSTSRKIANPPSSRKL